MDNLCHTLVGAAIGETGLKRRSALGTATLIIGANLPDVDVISVVIGADSLDFRRGITHGVLALVLWPFILTATMMLWDRLVRRRGGRVPVAPIRPRALLLLSGISILSHPLLDWMNTYGMRWLMPFSDDWFYADVLFIIDPWIWLTLGLAIVMTAGRLRDGRPARLALACVTLYIAAMAGLTIAGRAEVRRALAAAGLDPESRLLVAPVPVNPVRREVLVDAGDRYVFGTLVWSPGPRVTLGLDELMKRDELPEARAAAATPAGSAFLRWARFPYYRVGREEGDAVVFIGDARYNRVAGRTWAAVTVRLPEGAEDAAGAAP